MVRVRFSKSRPAQGGSNTRTGLPRASDWAGRGRGKATHRFRFSPRTARSPIMVPVPQSHLSGDNVGGPPMTSFPQLRPLGELLGTEALGIDLSRPLDEVTFAWIGRVFAEHPVLVFRDQNLGAAELAAFGRWFGSPRMHALVKYRHAKYPEECPGLPMSRTTARWIGTASSAPLTGTRTQHTKLIRRYSLSCTPRKFRPQKAAPCSPICVPPMIRYQKP